MSDQEVAIRDHAIRLGQLLQLAGLVDSGAEAKLLLADVEVLVDGQAESRRGRQVPVGAVVTVADRRLRVVSASAGPGRG